MGILFCVPKPRKDDFIKWQSKQEKLHMKNGYNMDVFTDSRVILYYHSYLCCSNCKYGYCGCFIINSFIRIWVKRSKLCNEPIKFNRGKPAKCNKCKQIHSL